MLTSKFAIIYLSENEINVVFFRFSFCATLYLNFMNVLVLKLNFNWNKSMYKIWQILKHLSRASSWAQTSSFRSVFMERKIQSQYNQFSLERCSVYLATFSYWRSKIGFGSNYIDDEELPRYSKTNFQYAIAWYTFRKKSIDKRLCGCWTFIKMYTYHFS